MSEYDIGNDGMIHSLCKMEGSKPRVLDEAKLGLGDFQICIICKFDIAETVDRYIYIKRLYKY